MIANVRLGDIAPVMQGRVKSNSKSVWLLNLDMVESETGKIIEYQFVSPNKVGTSTCQFDTGNVLYSKLRPYLNKVVLPDKEGYATSEMLPLKPDTAKVSREYLTYYLRSPAFVAYISDKVAGAKMPRARTEDLQNAIIPLPSMDKQEAIVNILDKVTDLVSIREQQIAKLNELVKSQFIEMFGDPEENPFKWLKCSLSEIIIKANNGMSRRGNDIGGNIVLRLVELQKSYINYENPNRIMLTEAEKQRYLLERGDFLFARVNGNPDYVGRCAVFNSLSEPVYHNDHIIRVHFDETKLNEIFASVLFNSLYGRKQMQDKIKTSAGQYTINQEGIGSVVTILPPVDLQKQFADFVQQTDKSKFEIQKSLEKFEKLKKALMQQYFEQ